jgi:hypothetical protein
MEGDLHNHVERLLVEARPAPDPEFVRTTEAELVYSRRDHGRLLRIPRMTFRPGLALTTAGGLAAAFLVAALVGGGPLSVHGTTESRARDLCRVSESVAIRKVDRLERLRSGEVRVITKQVPTPSYVLRCR